MAQTRETEPELSHEDRLAQLTGKSGWESVDGPDSGVGQDYWYAHPDGQTAYINVDQGEVTVDIDAD